MITKIKKWFNQPGHIGYEQHMVGSIDDCPGCQHYRLELMRKNFNSIIEHSLRY